MSITTREECIGDGNCLFRALGDQLDGQVQEHMAHREAVVRYMRHHRWLISTSFSTPVDYSSEMTLSPSWRTTSALTTTCQACLSKAPLEATMRLLPGLASTSALLSSTSSTSPFGRYYLKGLEIVLL